MNKETPDEQQFPFVLYSILFDESLSDSSLTLSEVLLFIIPKAVVPWSIYDVKSINNCK